MEVLREDTRKKYKPKNNASADLLLGRIPPQALDLEEAVLGALLIDNKEALNKVSDFLKADAFYDDRHKKIYNAILRLSARSEPVDLRTVVNELRFAGDLEIVGGAYFVSQLTFKIQSSANIEYHARILVQYAIKRHIISISADLQRNAFDDTEDVFEMLDHAQEQIFGISEQIQKRNYDNVTNLTQMALKEIEEKRKHKDGLTGVPSGFTDLDRLTSGWQQSDLVIVAARPAMGKTAFILSMVRNAAVDHERPCAIFSLEMSSVQLMLRLISAEAEIESDKIKKGKLEDHEWVQLTRKVSKLSSSKIFIDDTPALSVLELRGKCRRLKAQHNIQMVVIDYLQLMRGNEGDKSQGNREQEIGYISRSLKGLAKELEIPVIALSQLSRAVETRNTGAGSVKKPQLSDLRESGSIEQDADMVIFLYRPEYYGLTEDESGQSTKGLGEIIVAKHRNGPVDTVKLKYISHFTKFTNFDFDINGGHSDFASNTLKQGNDYSFPDVKGSGTLGGEKRIKSKMNDIEGKNKDIDLGTPDDGDAPF
ncbi:MAG: replicative DNA helicase [Cytophagales bacterium]|nr:replicative DNA helicase [Cytophagales bacterium]